MGSPPPSDGYQSREMRIGASRSAYTVSFEENFGTYVAFMKAFRDVWDGYLAGWPAAVGEGAPVFANYDSNGSPATLTPGAIDMAKYNTFVAAISQIMANADASGWIQKI